MPPAGSVRPKAKPKKKAAPRRPAGRRPEARRTPSRAPAVRSPPPSRRSHAKGSSSAPSGTVKLTFRPDARRHLLSLSFLRDGDEFLARMETDSGQITEMKNRALDQLLSLVAGELEDVLD